MNSILATALMAGLAIGGLGAAEMMGKKVTVEGTLVDSKCYGMMHSNTGNDHQSADGVMKGCAAKCAKDGIPVAVLQKNGKVLILSAPAKLFSPHMAKDVRVVGMVPFEGTIIPEKVEVQSVGDKWEEVKITTMM
ncbi:MAG: hypothetical protein L0Z50_03630 [Verrucomicrobiales bacterium]|nr:hypothetical protein [Verrucomicrobiales bacterium]